jgi:hypothetical protein
MSIETNSLTNTTPFGMFPNIPNADSDRKCIAICNLFKEFSAFRGFDKLNQNNINEWAENRYAYLSSGIKVSLTEVENIVTNFKTIDVEFAPETLKNYYSFLLTNKDLNRWNIVPIQK